MNTTTLTQITLGKTFSAAKQIFQTYFKLQRAIHLPPDLYGAVGTLLSLCAKATDASAGMFTIFVITLATYPF